MPRPGHPLVSVAFPSKSAAAANNTAVVGTPSSANSNASSNTLAITRTIAAGSTLVAIYTCDTGPGLPAAPSVADTASGSWSAVQDNTDDTTSQQGGGTFICKNHPGGTNVVVTLTLGAAPANDRTAKGFAILEISGANTTTQPTGHTGQNQASAGTGTDAVTSGNITPSGSPGMIVGFCLRTSGTTVAVSGTGYTDDGAVCDLGLGGNPFIRIEHKQVANTNAVAATFTQAANNRNLVFEVGVLSS